MLKCTLIYDYVINFNGPPSTISDATTYRPSDDAAICKEVNIV